MSTPKPGPLRTTRPPVLAGNLALVAGRPWTHALFWLIILVAAGVDIVTFYQVLILVLNVIDPLVWVAVTGFTIVALTLAHFVGLKAKQAASPRNIRGAGIAAVVCLVVWLGLGTFAFIVRYQISPSTGASVFTNGVQKSDFGQAADLGAQHLSALLFLVLYLGTGLVSALAGFFRHEPAIREYARALGQRSKAARRHAASASRLALATATMTAIDRARIRREAAWETTEKQCVDAAERLRQEAHLRLRRPEMLPPPAPGGPPRPRSGESAAPAGPIPDDTIPVIFEEGPPS